MTPEQIRGRVMDILMEHPPREVTVTEKPGPLSASFTGEIHFAGRDKFRLDAPLGCLFFKYTEVESVE